MSNRLLPVLVIASLLWGAVPGGAAGAAGPGSPELRADTLTVDTARQVIEARGRVRITDGRTVARCERAVYTIRERRILLTGKVVITTPDGTLDAAQAVIRLGSGRSIETIEASGGAEVEGRQRVLRADLIAYGVSTKVLTARGNVQFFTPPDIIASGRDLVATGQDTAVLTGRARVANHDGFIQGDRLEVQRSTQSAFLRGNVVGEFRDTRLTSEAATLFAREKKAVFTGHVTVVRPGRTMTTERLTVYYQENRIVAEGPTQMRIEDGEGGPSR